MKFAAFFPSFLFVGNCIAQQRINEPYPNELILAAENFARQQNIPPAMVLLLSARSVLSYNSAKTDCNMLSVVTLLDLIKVRTRQTDFPTVLGVNLRVVLISPYDRSLVQKEIPGGFDVLRYLRHKFLLHIITSTLGKDFTPSVPTLLWKQETNIVFYCVRSFDHLIFWDSKPTTQSCQSPKPVCELHRVEQSVGEIFALLQLEVTLEFQCNSTKISAYYLANFQDRDMTVKTLNVDTHMRTLFLTYPPAAVQCYKAYRMRPTDVTALLLPFDADVWFGTLFCALLTATTLSYMVSKRLSTTIAEILLGFIAACPIDIKLRQYSSLIAGMAIITLTFFINQIYSNCFMSVFLHPFAFVESHGHAIDCKFQRICRDHPEFHYSILDSGKAICSLTEFTKSQYGKPLHRYLELEEKLEVGGKSPFWMLQRYARNPLKTSGDFSKGGHTLVFTRRSKTLDKLLQYGMIPLTRFEYMRPRQEWKVFATLADSGLKRTKERLKKIPRNGNVYSGSIDIRFEWQSLLKLLPLFGLCMIPTVLCFATELFSRRCVRFRRHLNGCSTRKK